MVLIEGGEVQSPGFRSASNETGKLTYHQTGGKVVLRGEVGSDLRGKTEATFDIKGSNNVFIMTGGEIEIQDPVTERNWLNWPTVYRALRIESGEGNYSVSGGSVRIERSSGSDNATFPIQSTAPFYNLSIGGGQTQKQTNVQLSSAIRVLNDLTIGAQGYLDAVNSSRSISVGRHFTLNSGGAFNSRANVFTFDGSQSSVVTNATGSALVFGDLYVAKEVGFTGNYTLSFAGDGAVEIGKGLHLQRGDFRIEENRTIALKGNANLFHGSVLGAGRLNLNGSNTQTLFSDQGKAQSFGSLLINNNVQLTSAARASWMEFGENRVVDINKHNLELTNPNVYGATGWAANKQIRTSGLSSDGGLTLPVNSANGEVQFFPLGVEGGAMAYARITGAESTARLGKVTVVPVNGRHPGAVSAASGLVDFYFKTNLEFEDAQSFGFQFYFPKTWNPNYPGLVLNNGTWTEQDITKSPSTSTLVDFNNTKSLQGPTDFAVGHKNAVKNPRVLESRNGGGEWNEPGSWTDKGTGNVANSAPTSTDIVYIIEDHEINIPDDSNPSAGQVIFKPSDDSQTPKLVIGTGNSPAKFTWTKIQGQTYDYVYNSGSSFGEVSGRGHIQVNGTTLPSANYTAFLRQEGAIMEYASATAFTLPVNSSVTFTGTNGPSNGPTVLSTFNEYPTLRISGGGTKTGADIDLVIHEDLQVNSDFVLSGEDNGNIRVLRDVAVNAANLLLPGAGNRAFKVEGNVLVSGGGEWGISGNGNNGILHQVNLEGDLTLENGRVNFNKTAKADVYFSGVKSSTFSADEDAAASFYRLHINKPEHTKALFNGAFTLTESVQGLVLNSGIAHLNSLGINVLLNSGSGDFIIPAEASLLISNGAIVRTNGTNRGLVLHGKLQVGQGGIANLNGGTNNYLEYSASGKSTIVVEGNGELYIGSQLRRSTETEAGILHFAQLGADSKVVVGDKDSGTPTRAMFEILNEGSTFRQAAGAVLTIKNQKGGSENYDLIFDPSTSTFGKGSAIEILTGNASADFDIYAVKALQNLKVGGSAGTVVKARLALLPLTLNENLLIQEQGEFNSGGRDVFINAGMVNNGSFVAAENTVHFTGSGTIGGTAASTVFYNLSKTLGTGTLYLANDVSGVQVDNHLLLERGRIDTQETSLVVKGGFTLEEGTAVLSSGESSGVVMQGAASQQVRGGGTIDRLTINNPSGVVVPTQGGVLHITEALRLAAGVFDIGQNLISFAPAAVVSPVNDFGPGNMVQTNLSMTDSGILKYLASGASSFDFPIGFDGKYTPVRLQVQTNSSSNGAIRVKPANEPHITVAPENRGQVLNYYWTLASTNLSSFSAKIEMEADKALARGVNADGSNYVLARIRSNDATWNKPMPDVFVVDGTRVKLQFALNEDDFSGDYTAGVESAIPDQVATYRTKGNGNWTAPIWEKLNHATQLWESTTDSPIGSILYIDHSVTVTENRKTAFRVIFNDRGINGELRFGSTLNHRLSNVYGTGRIVLETGSLPAADYTQFFSAQGGTIEFGGNSTFPILANVPVVNHLEISGGGTKTIAADLTVRGNLKLSGGTLQQMTARVEAQGQVERTAGTYTQTAGSLRLTGANAQSVSGGLELRELLVRNGSGVTLTADDVLVNNRLTLEQGRIHTQSGAMIELGSNASIVRSSTAHFINGPMRKNQVAGNTFFLPVGKDDRSGDVGISPSITSKWEAEYFNQEPANRENKGAGVDYVSDNEFWVLNPVAASGNARVYLKWDVNSGVNPSDPSLQILNYQDNLWKIVARTAPVSQSLPTSSAVSFNGSRSFTFGFTAPEEDEESPYPPYTWLGAESDNWFTGNNWAGGFAPSAHHDVNVLRDKNISRMPVINYSADGQIAMTNNLTLQEGGSLTLNPGGKLTVNGDLSIADEGALIMKNTTEVNGLASLIVEGAITGAARAEGKRGEVTIELEFPYDEWYYVSQPIKDAKSDIYGVWNEDGSFSTNEGWVNVHRANRWYRIGGGVDIAQLEGVSNKYRPADGNNHVVSYVGRLNNEAIARNYSNRQYYLFGNPYPSSINWQDDKGWERNNIGATLWYRTRVNGNMTFVTYNRNADPGARAAIYPDGGGFDEEAQLALIPPLQSAWMGSLGASSVSITKDAQLHTPEGAFLKSSSNANSNVVRITAENATSRDGAVLYFSANALEGLDKGDSEKMFNEPVEIPEVYTRVGSKAVAINGLPELKENVRTIPLSVRNRMKGEVSLNFDMSLYSGEHDVYFEDKETGAFMNVNRTPSYTYSVGSVGDNHERFALHFYKVATGIETPSAEEEEAGSAIQIRNVSNKVMVSASMELVQAGPGRIEVYTIEGRKVSEVPAQSSRTLIFLPKESGVYIVRAAFGQLVKSERVLGGLSQD